MKRTQLTLLVAIALVFGVVGCESVPSDAELSSEAGEPTATSNGSSFSSAAATWRPLSVSPGIQNRILASSRHLPGLRAEAMHAQDGGAFEFAAEVFDIAAGPDGSILVVQSTPVDPPTAPATYGTTKVMEIRKGEVGEVIEVHTEDSPLNGLAVNGRRSFFATSGGLDLAAGAGVYHVSQGRARLIGDVEAFENETDPDALAGPQWKHPACEFNPNQGFSAGPQSNPYHPTVLTGSTALVPDAAGNTLLSTSKSGHLDWVAVFTPPVVEDEWLVLFPLDEETNCYVQPVPTSVAVGPDGEMYVGELTGVTPAELGGDPAAALSRVWRIAPGAQNVVCPSADCEEIISGLTSVIDLAFGPDGNLYVVEYDENGWFAVVTGGDVAGGTINRCNVETGDCEPVASELTLPSAITFDKWGQLWLLESNIIAPTVRKVEL